MAEIRHDNDAVERLIAETRSPDVLTRLRAAEALGTTGDSRAVEPLIALLDDPTSRVILAALTSLGNLGKPSAVQAIAAVFESHDLMATMGRAHAISTAAAEALRKLGEPGFQSLIRLLREHFNSEFEGVALVLALGKLADPRSLDALAVALHSSVFEVNMAAATTLAKFGEEALEVLVAALQSPNGDVAHYAGRALNLFGATPLPSLLELLRTSEAGYVRAEVVRAIAAIDDPQVPDMLRSALADTDEDVRQAAAEVLGQRGDASVIDRLLDLPRPEPNQGLDTAVDMLATFGPPVTVPLLRALQNPARSAEARARAAETLGKIGNKNTIWPLIAALRDDDEQVRQAAAGALGELQDARAVAPLLEALASDTPGVRRAAVQALGHFDDARAVDALIQVARTAGRDRDARRVAIYALAINQRERALPVLRELALARGERRENQEEYPVAAWAVSMLTRFGQPGVDALIEVVRSQEAWMSEVALHFVGPYGTPLDPSVAEQLAMSLHDSRPRVRRQVAIVLGESGDARAIEPLIEIVLHPSPIGRLEAARVLGKIGDERALPALEQALAEGMNTGGTHNLHPSVEVELRDTIQDAILSIRTRQREQAKAAEPTPAESEHSTHD